MILTGPIFGGTQNHTFLGYFLTDPKMVILCIVYTHPDPGVRGEEGLDGEGSPESFRQNRIRDLSKEGRGWMGRGPRRGGVPGGVPGPSRDRWSTTLQKIAIFGPKF